MSSALMMKLWEAKTVEEYQYQDVLIFWFFMSASASRKESYSSYSHLQSAQANTVEWIKWQSRESYLS